MSAVDRGEFIAGLRALADLLEQTPDVPVPHARGGIGNDRIEFVWGSYGDDAADEIAAIRRAIGGQWGKNDPAASDWDATYFKVTRHLHGVDLVINSTRSAVCERVVTGTREVVEDVPVAFEKVTKTVEDVEWVCKPLLSDVTA